MDPARVSPPINFRSQGATPSGVQGGGLSHEACLDRLLGSWTTKDLSDKLKSENASAAASWASASQFSWSRTRPVPASMARQASRISAQEGCTLRLEPSGAVTCITSNPDQGQGVETALAQLIAEELELPLEAVRVVGGDTLMTQSAAARSLRAA